MDNLTAIARQAMIEHGLQPDFSPEAQRQADSIAQPRTRPAIRDLRALLWCSIDNDDTRDLDQLTVAEPAADGGIKILVAIADVDALVARRSAIDDHASSNTTSVYTAAKVFPMLPEKLSTDLTSLHQDQDRLAVVIEMTISTEGNIASSDVYRAFVLNHAKLTYNGVAAWLDGNAPAPALVATVSGLDRQLRQQDQVAQTLRRVRYARGALNFETVEARPVFNDGVLTDLRADERNRAKELIEDFMIASNGVVARYLQGKRRSLLRRVLRSPERWPRIVALASSVGERLPPQPDALALNALLASRRAADPATFPEFSVSVLKLLGSSEYAVELPNQPAEGHFGLAVNEYTHSTAPNRRFPDLITQRLIKAALDNEPPAYSDAELSELAAHCTAQEKNATKVERQVRKAAAALLLINRVGQQFNGIVTGASEKGTWVRVSEPIAEGKVVKGSAGLDVGDRVRVELVHVDPERGFIDFARR
jgi:exoribonuclease-2